MPKIGIFSWRDAIQQSALASTTRLVLLNLSIYMNDKGQSCFPTIDTQAKDTGLSSKAVCQHIQKAVDAGFLIKRQHGFSGKKWANNEYVMSYPPDCELSHTVAEIAQERGSIPLSEGIYPGSEKVCTDVPSNSSLTNSSLTIKNKNIKNKKLSLAQWEEKAGATLNANMCKKWLIENRITQEVAQKLIEQFRIKCEANGNVYSNFVRAFQDRLTMGYLSLTLEGARNLSRKTENVHITNTGLSL